ncbi:26S proteasome non-ATPase regulatory subunit 10-like isoform X4 [Paramuricea clavata]|uniref:26S proteasome non-ATPase regulatory subunit 10-like isoform X4 n=1 Tax=Paramuricea clavata TaxID=317549 RepID=A0A7D9HUE0_PARCT|nr:26S proteasome non-ATPase regulatory subunit 10-like isoform X4 [Paramuricea clavata]
MTWRQLLNATNMTNVNPLINGTSRTSHEWVMKPVLLLIILLLLRQFCSGVRKSKKKMKIKLPRSLFDMAKLAYKSETCESLISYLKDQKDLDVNERMAMEITDNQMTLFLCACFSGNERLLRFMLCYGGDIHTRTKWADSPLHLVTFALSSNKNKRFGAIDVLLEAGCDINCKNWIGNTPLCIAASHGNTRLIKYLLRKGADPSMGNSKGIYPIDFANNADNGDAADLLKFDVPNPYVWDVIEPHTPPRIKLGLQSPSKQHLADSTFTRRQSMRQKHVLN